MRKFYWYTVAYFRKHGWVFFSSLVLALIIFGGLVPLISRNLVQKPREYIGLVGQYSLYNLPAEIKNNLLNKINYIFETFFHADAETIIANYPMAN